MSLDPSARCRRAVIGLGSNLGDREGTLNRALELISKLTDVRLLACSGIWETEPVGGPPQPNYCNAAVCVETELPPGALLQALLSIEQQCGRVRSVRNGPRTLDLDLLWIEGVIVEDSDLQVPHPRLDQRPFALAPLVQVAPDARDPRSGLLYVDILAMVGGPTGRYLRRPLDAPRT